MNRSQDINFSVLPKATYYDDNNNLLAEKFPIDADGNSIEGEIAPNQQSELLTGFLEKSNVNAIEEMVNTIDHQRKFEMHIKFIQMAEELDASSSNLMRLPGM